MGDFGTSSLFTSSSVSLSTSPTSPGTLLENQFAAMQDDLLIEKQNSTKPAPLSPGGLDTVISSGQEKSKDIDSITESLSIVSTQSSMDKDMSSCGTISSLQRFADPVRVGILWASDLHDDTTDIHALPVNGSIAQFQNFPAGGPAGLFGGNNTGARRAITASHNFPHGGTGASVGVGGSGSAIVGTGGSASANSAGRHGQQTQQVNQQGQQQPTSHPGVYLQGKGYAAWSGGPQAPQQWGGAPQAASPAMSPWNRGRSVPNLPPLHSSLHAAAAVAAAANLQGRKPSPTFPGHPSTNQAHPSNISPVKFRRSTSYPGKQNLYPPQPAPTFEVTAADERDLLQMPSYQQERMSANGNSPLNNMRTWEHYLSDIMRAGAADTSEHMKVSREIYIFCPLTKLLVN